MYECYEIKYLHALLIFSQVNDEMFHVGYNILHVPAA